MIAISILTYIIFILLIASCLFLVIVGLPGTWGMILLAGLLEYLDYWLLPGNSHSTTFGLTVFLICILLASIGELLEFLAGVFGAKKFGASKRGMVGAFVGGIAGAILGIFIPVPIVGSIIGAILGTFGGALVGEMGGSLGPYQDALKPATGATLGKILGILSKLPIALMVWFILSLKLFWSIFLV